MRVLAYATVAFVLTILTLFNIAGEINHWERRHSYPYGKMCNSVFSGGVDTCPKGK